MYFNVLILEDEMKKNLLAVVIIFSMIYFGCSDSVTNVEPVSKTSSNVSWIKLSNDLTLSEEGSLSKSEKILGFKGGELTLSGNLSRTKNQRVYVFAQLDIPSRAFNGIKTLTMEVGDDAAVDFYPSMTFDRPLTLTLVFTGLDLKGIDPSKVNFYYIAPDGSLQIAPNDGVTIDKDKGILSVKNAEVPHFSRYGFAT